MNRPTYSSTPGGDDREGEGGRREHPLPSPAASVSASARPESLIEAVSMDSGSSPRCNCPSRPCSGGRGEPGGRREEVLGKPVGVDVDRTGPRRAHAAVWRLEGLEARQYLGLHHGDRGIGGPPRPRQVDVDDLVDGAARGEHDDAVGQLDGLGHVVGDEHDGPPRLQPDPLQMLPQRARRHGVEVREGLVHEQHVRLHGERPRDADALLLATGELGREAVRAVAQPDQVQVVPGALLPARPFVLDEAKIGHHGAPRQQPRVLKDVAHPGIPVTGPQGDRPRGVRLDAGDDVQQRGLAAAGRADDGDERLARDRQVDAVDDAGALPLRSWKSLTRFRISMEAMMSRSLCGGGNQAERQRVT